MQVKFNVQRLDPDSTEKKPYFQEYLLDVTRASTVLDALINIREEVDGSLTLRCSCRSAICGSCAMRINGQAGLACNTRVVDIVKNEGGTVTVEPAGNFSVIKDLVVDFQPFWEKVRDVQPWLRPGQEIPEHEYIASNADMMHLAEVMACIMCGACVSDCTVLEVDKNFLGPAALAKAYRFVGDPRDSLDRERLESLSEYGGIWDCTRCLQCVEVCPKGVDPMDRIMMLRDKAIELGYTNSNGARHAKAFTESVGKSGWLDELRLPIKSFGITNIREMLRLIPVGLRAQFRGKRPPIFHKSIPGVENVRYLFKKLEGGK